MEGRAVSGIMLTLLFIGTLASAFNIRPVKASGTINIRPDGSVNPPTAPISGVDNVTYTFTWNGLEVTIVTNSSTIFDFKVGRTVLRIIGNSSLDPIVSNGASGTRFIMFNVTGETGTLGFCHVAIPKALMYDVNTVGVRATSLNYTETDNDTHVEAYFVYPHINGIRIEISGDIDETPPVTNVTQQPKDVQPTDKVEIIATITDDQSGVRRAILDYNNGTQSWRKEMTNLEGNIWNATIPAFPQDTNVSYYITAEDNVGNPTITQIYEYQVTLTEGDKVMPYLFAVLMIVLVIAFIVIVAVKKRARNFKPQTPKTQTHYSPEFPRPGSKVGARSCDEL